MEVAILDIKGKDTGRKVNLNDSVFGIEPNEHVLYLDVKQYLANQRQGTHKAKERAEITGSTRKIKKQKGTGTARAGSIKNPLFRGGGRVFGPRPRDYRSKLNKKVKSLAKRSALSLKASNDQIMVLENINFDTPSTKNFVQMIGDLNLKGEKLLLVIADQNNNVYLSSRNIKGAEVVTVSELSTYDLMNTTRVVLSEASVEKIESILS